MAMTTSRETLWGVGQMATVGQPVEPYPVTFSDIQRDAVWLGRQLSRFRVAPGSFMMLVSMGWETAHIRPFEIAAASLAFPTCDVGPASFDAERMLGLLDSLPVRIVVGVSEGIVNGLADAGRPAEEVLADAVVFARPESRLKAGPRAAGNVFDWVLLGPAVAMECPARRGAHVNRHEWDVVSTADGLQLSGLVGARRDIAEIQTGRRGTVIHDQCSCGSGDPRVILE